MSVTLGVALLNLVIGGVYTSYGVITAIDLRRGWSTHGFSHFGAAWIAMAFTCGPHHLEHGLHILIAGREGAPVEIVSLLVGLPFGVLWFLLRIEALAGGRGDRFVAGTPWWLVAAPYVALAYLMAGLTSVSVVVAGADRGALGPRLTPNALLVVFYGQIGYYLLRTQLANRPRLGGWSVSGISLTAVFPTCAGMHASFLLYASVGRYDADPHGLLIDWLSVPASVYFVWVVRALYVGSIRDWNRGSVGAVRAPDLRPTDAATAAATATAGSPAAGAALPVPTPRAAPHPQGAASSAPPPPHATSR